MLLGLHLSVRKPLDGVVDRAIEKECNVFQMFSRNPRGWARRELESAEIDGFRAKLSNNSIESVFIHTPYLLNLASPRAAVHQRSTEVLVSELSTADQLNVPFVVTHLGSHLGQGRKEGIRRIVKAINKVFRRAENRVTLLLENNAGTRNSIGSSFEDIVLISSEIVEESRLGVCFDTCHAFAAGYDLTSQEAVEKTLQGLNETIGLREIKLVHLNDSKRNLGSGVDRHEHIGLGTIGDEGFRNILGSKLGQLPLILETPIDKRRTDVENLRRIRELAGGRLHAKFL